MSCTWIYNLSGNSWIPHWCYGCQTVPPPHLILAMALPMSQPRSGGSSGWSDLLQVASGLPSRSPGISHLYRSWGLPLLLPSRELVLPSSLDSSFLISRNFLTDEWGQCFGSRELGLGAERRAYTELAPSRRTDYEIVNRALRVHFEK